MNIRKINHNIFFYRYIMDVLAIKLIYFENIWCMLLTSMLQWTHTYLMEEFLCMRKYFALHGTLSCKINYNGCWLKEVMSSVHSRTASRLLDVCLENGGLYIKFGQGLVSMGHVLPKVAKHFFLIRFYIKVNGCLLSLCLFLNSLTLPKRLYLLSWNFYGRFSLI